MARVSAAEAAAARKRIRRVASRVLHGTANADGAGLLERGREYQPVQMPDLGWCNPRVRGYEGLDPLIVTALVRLARLSERVGEALREFPDPVVRRSAAVLAARAHPVRVAFDA